MPQKVVALAGVALLVLGSLLGWLTDITGDTARADEIFDPNWAVWLSCLLPLVAAAPGRPWIGRIVAAVGAFFALALLTMVWTDAGITSELGSHDQRATGLVISTLGGLTAALAVVLPRGAIRRNAASA